jgi:hypothetical protein
MTISMNSRVVPLFSRYEVNEITGCWLWLGYVNEDGYARAGEQNAHRLFYTHFIGPVPDGYDVDHQCKRRDCVNPDHLEAVTEAENNRRRTRTVTLAGKNFQMCRQGHLIRGENVSIRNRNGKQYRQCWLCSRPGPEPSRIGRRRAHALRDAAPDPGVLEAA